MSQPAREGISRPCRSQIAHPQSGLSRTNLCENMPVVASVPNPPGEAPREVPGERPKEQPLPSGPREMPAPMREPEVQYPPAEAPSKPKSPMEVPPRREASLQPRLVVRGGLPRFERELVGVPHFGAEGRTFH